MSVRNSEKKSDIVGKTMHGTSCLEGFVGLDKAHFARLVKQLKT